MRSVLNVDAKAPKKTPTRSAHAIEVGKRIAAARKIAGIGRPELASRINIDGFGDKTIGNIERGDRPLRPHELVPFAEALQVPLEFLDPEPEPEPELVEPPADTETTDQRLDRIEQGMAERTAEVKALLETQNALLARQSAILEKIEAAIRREEAAASRGARLLDQAAQHIEQVLPGAALGPEEAPTEHATPGNQAG